MIQPVVAALLNLFYHDLANSNGGSANANSGGHNNASGGRDDTGISIKYAIELKPQGGQSEFTPQQPCFLMMAIAFEFTLNLASRLIRLSGPWAAAAKKNN